MSIDKGTKAPQSSAKNPYPDMFKSIKAYDRNLELLAKVNPSTLSLDCKLRNDSPYYWCYIEADLVEKHQKHPQKIGAVYHTVVDKRGVEVSKNVINQFKKDKTPTILVISFKTSISENNSMFSTQLMGMYNSKTCINLFDDFTNCPKKSKKLDIHTGNIW